MPPWAIFAEHGYDASSLNEIATLAGMRKASLYAHFASKDALFVQVFQRALVEETAYVELGFQQEMAPCCADSVRPVPKRSRARRRLTQPSTARR